MQRRHFLFGTAALAAGLATAREATAEPGISAAPDLYAAVTGLRGVSEGSGRGTMHILYAPWCPRSPELYRDTRAFLGRLRVNWIPFAGGQPEGRTGTEFLLRSGQPSDIPNSFTTLRPLMPIASTPLSDAQDAALQATVLPRYYRDAGGSLYTPTIFYSMAGDRIRVVKGAPQPQHIEQIALLAS
ncbi:hypothetical protein [Rhizobium sp. BK176]|uniref:hypothetical protein n=1 Tax=Rhizobium sp. BK176 TaxID=2587071 RepID=UPI0021688EA9|nr:hypothetical protein [Rhizobium sp. BK176]MCS4089803.1 hypothetical protein [Rhizobium sp. BK176]